MFMKAFQKMNISILETNISLIATFVQKQLDTFFHRVKHTDL